MKEENITRYRLDRNNPHEPDWTAFDAMTDEEVEAAALADPDAQPMTEEQLALMVCRPHGDIIRQSFGLTQEEFATKFGIPLATLKSWEDRSVVPDRVGLALLAVIVSDPDAVERAVHRQGGAKAAAE